MADPFLAVIPQDELVRRGNVMARCRMILLYDRSAREQALVLGTGNRTEALLGYTTLYGDNACALNPIGRLYKTEVRLLARWLGLPAAVLDKAPSADLWQGQADEDELGFTYAEVGPSAAPHDRPWVWDPGQLAALGFAPGLVKRVAARVKAWPSSGWLPPVAAIPGRPDPDQVGSADVPARKGPATDGGFH